MDNHKNSEGMIIGLGTGRCGTQSLASILNIQHNVKVTHECLPVLPWQANKNILDEKFDNILKRPAKIRGDIAFYYLPYVPYIATHYSQAKFICMKRPMEETVASYMKKTMGRNHWNFHDGVSCWQRDPIFDPAYPKYQPYSCERADGENLIIHNIRAENLEIAENIKKRAIEQYWKDYYQLAATYEEQYPQKFKIFQMRDLNIEERIKDILNFCGIEDKAIVVSVKERSNA